MKKGNNSKKNGGILKKRVVLTREECYCGIAEFYRNVATKCGAKVHEETAEFNCTEICVTAAVQDAIFSYYKEEKKASRELLGSIWLMYGPKATLEGGQEDFAAEVTEKFLNNAPYKGIDF